MENIHKLKASSPLQQPPIALREQLTPRELDVLALLCEGLPNKTIGRRLNIASGTVKVHVTQILRTLNVSSRLQALVATRSLGLEFKSDGAEPMQPETDIPSRHVTALRSTPADWDASRLQAVMFDHSWAAAA